MSPDVVAYFKKMTEETNIPYQSLINLYLLNRLYFYKTYSAIVNS